MNVGLFISLGIIMAARTISTDQASIKVYAAEAGPRISPMLRGIFFEEINHAGDGGLYAEMIRNRSLEDAETPENWEEICEGGASGELGIDDSKPLNEWNKRALKVVVKSTGNGRYGAANSGFWRLPVVEGKSYNCTVIARCEHGFDGQLAVQIESAKGTVHASEKIGGLASDWSTHRFTLSPKKSDSAARLTITASSPGTFYLEFVSLLPSDAKDGLRTDLVEFLAGLKPAFVRFPGGCYVEGEVLKDAWRWKGGIGPQEARRTHWNLWGYQNTNGLGLHEYLLLCERLKAEPLLVTNCGMSHRENAPMDKLGEWIQEALDAIEYANGDVSTTWGAKRAASGHPEPFNLKYFEIGNENSGPAYEERFAAFYDAIKAKYPYIQCISDVPVTSRSPDIIDEHYYSSPDWFASHANQYDSYKRDGRRIYVGEYAVVGQPGVGNLRAALAEALFMMGMERNSDVVVMSSYAPLFVNVNDRKWNPDMIQFDADRVCGTPSYYAHKLFAENRGDVVLRTEVNGPTKTMQASGGIGLGTWATQSEYKDIEVKSGAKVLCLLDEYGVCRAKDDLGHFVGDCLETSAQDFEEDFVFDHRIASPMRLCQRSTVTRKPAGI